MQWRVSSAEAAATYLVMTRAKKPGNHHSEGEIEEPHAERSGTGTGEEERNCDAQFEKGETSDSKKLQGPEAEGRECCFSRPRVRELLEARNQQKQRSHR